MSIKLKLLRVQAKLTLEELAQAASMTRGYLSKIERGLSRPSIGGALKLAKALRVPVEELFGEPNERDPVKITRAADAKKNADLRGSPRVVAGTSPGHRMLAFLLRPGQVEAGQSPMSHHDGEEILYVLKGRVSLQLADRKEALGAGDCAHFSSTVPHKITAIGDNTAEVLIVIATDDG
jgi:transcriptional regulator with XRE-family HTH domain